MITQADHRCYIWWYYILKVIGLHIGTQSWMVILTSCRYLFYQTLVLVHYTFNNGLQGYHAWEFDDDICARTRTYQRPRLFEGIFILVCTT